MNNAKAVFPINRFSPFACNKTRLLKVERLGGYGIVFAIISTLQLAKNLFDSAIQSQALIKPFTIGANQSNSIYLVFWNSCSICS